MGREAPIGFAGGEPRGGGPGARGGDQYPFRGAPFTTLGVTYQQALRNDVEQLPGAPLPVISAADYPEGGEGRIRTCTPALCP
jgi:hypothetical protein